MSHYHSFDLFRALKSPLWNVFRADNTSQIYFVSLIYNIYPEQQCGKDVSGPQFLTIFLLMQISTKSWAITTQIDAYQWLPKYLNESLKFSDNDHSVVSLMASERLRGSHRSLQSLFIVRRHS